ncbi:MAG: twin-arginine translocase subunit TatC [Candidatus Eremiobacteraeota bacterium]|nr:twin-arginine translocase subunit TatC [Candidatus Eremiobacteraeota bacterium]
MEDEFDPRMDLVDHMAELRRRIIISIVAWAVGTFAGWFLTPSIITYIKSFPQLKDIELILIRPPEAFFARLKLAVVVGLLFAIPIVIYQVVLFIIPAYQQHKKWVMRFVPASIILFYLGVLFFMWVLVPITLEFFLIRMAEGIAKPQLSLGEYVNYLVSMTLLGGLVFQVPILLFFLTMAGVLTSRQLMSGWKYAVVITFIVAAFATPPDPFSQVVVAVPMLVLYGLCVWFSRLAGK